MKSKNPLPSQLLPAEAEFRAWLNHEIAFTEKMVNDTRPTGLLPRLVVYGRQSDTGPHVVRVFNLNVSLNDSEEKQKCFAAIGERCYRKEKMIPVAAFFTAEAWLSNQRSGASNVQPSKDPARKEVVIIFARTLDGSLDSMASAPVFRDTGDVIRIGKFNTKFRETQSLLLEALFTGFKQAAFLDLRGKGKL